MENNTIQIQQALELIRIYEFAILADSYLHTEEVSLITNVELKTDVDNRKIGVIMTFDFIQNGIRLIKLKTGTFFELTKESWDLHINIGENNEIGMPHGLMNYYLTFCIDTTRGIFVSKTEGTIFAGMHFPIIDINQIAQEMQNRYQKSSKGSEQKLSESKTPKLKKLKSRKEKQIPKVL